MSRKTGKYIPCEICGKKTYYGGYEVKRYKSFFCSRAHKGKAKTEAIFKKISRTDIYQTYCVEKKSYRYICKKFNINNRTVPILLNHYGIKIRHGSEAIKTQWINNSKRRETQAIAFAHNTAPTRQPSLAEKKAMDFLKAKRIDFVFQYPLHRYILDFALLKDKIDIEIDGREHKFSRPTVRHDKLRTKWLTKQGWSILRFKDNVSTDEINKALSSL
jgi:very-short-patch-repair endonuclease